jgi:hypothetical protein
MCARVRLSRGVIRQRSATATITESEPRKADNSDGNVFGFDTLNAFFK